MGCVSRITRKRRGGISAWLEKLLCGPILGWWSKFAALCQKNCEKELTNTIIGTSKVCVVHLCIAGKTNLCCHQILNLVNRQGQNIKDHVSQKERLWCSFQCPWQCKVFTILLGVQVVMCS